jgi:hypothetical protein
METQIDTFIDKCEKGGRKVDTFSIYSQTCIKRSPLGQRKSGPVKTGDLLKEVQFI